MLTVQSFAWTSSQLANQKALLGSSTARLNLAKQVAAAIRDRGADGVNLDFEPIASGYAEEFTALVRTMRAELNKVAAGYQLTFDTTGYIGNYPIEDATASGGADADLRHGLRLPLVRVLAGRFDRPERRAALRRRRHGPRLHGARPGLEGHPRRAVLRARLVDLDRHAQCLEHLGREVRHVGDRAVRVAPATWPSPTAAATTPSRASPGPPIGARRARRRTAASRAGGRSTTRTWSRSRRSTTSSTATRLRGAGIWALGYDGTRTELYQAIADKFITDTIPPKIAGSALSSALVSPNADGRLDTVTASVSATGLDKWGYIVEPMVGDDGRDRRSGPGPSPTRSRSSPGTGSRPTARRAADGVYRLTVWTADASDNRAQRQFTVTLDTTPIAMGSTRQPDDDLARTATVAPTAAALRWSAAQRVTGTGRILDANGAKVTFWTLTARHVRPDDLDRDETRPARSCPDGKYTYRVTGLDPAGNATNRDLPVNVDRTIASVAWSNTSFDPRAGQKSQLSFRLIRPATVTVAIYLGSVVVRRVYTVRVPGGERRTAGPGTARTATASRSSPGRTR